MARRGTNEKTEQAEAGNGAAHAEWLAEIEELKQRLRDRAEAIGRREQELRKEEQRLEHHERRLGRRARVLRAQRHWFLPLTERKQRQPAEDGQAALESRARSIAEHERALELRIEEVEARAAQLQAADEALAAARSEADAREGQLELHANELAERERAFADLERRAAEIDASAAAHEELAADLQRRETELAARATELEDREGRLPDLDARAAEVETAAAAQGETAAILKQQEADLAAAPRSSSSARAGFLISRLEPPSSISAKRRPWSGSGSSRAWPRRSTTGSRASPGASRGR